MRSSEERQGRDVQLLNAFHCDFRRTANKTERRGPVTSIPLMERTSKSWTGKCENPKTVRAYGSLCLYFFPPAGVWACFFEVRIQGQNCPFVLHKSRRSEHARTHACPRHVSLSLCIYCGNASLAIIGYSATFFCCSHPLILSILTDVCGLGLG